MANYNCVEYLLSLLYQLKNVSQPYQHHPEGDAYTHSIQVLEEAMCHTNDPELLFSALFHDVGKIQSNRDHAEASIQLLSKCSFMNEKIIFLIRNHLRVAHLLSGEMKKQTKIEYLTNHEYFADLVELRKFDTLGRKAGYKPKISNSSLRSILMDIIKKIPIK